MERCELYGKFVDAVRGKNVIVVGPAACVIDDCRGIDVDSYDLVCRINYHWRVIDDDSVGLGKRVDVIYHCMNQEQYNRGDLLRWRDEGVFVLSPYDVHSGELEKPRDRGEIFVQRNKGVGLDCMSIKHYCLLINRQFDCFVNTGTLAVIHLLDMPTASVTVAGFDFYESLYWNRENEKVRSYIKNQNITHNIKVQLESFKKHVSGNDRFIPLGRLKEIVNDEK